MALVAVAPARRRRPGGAARHARPRLPPAVRAPRCWPRGRSRSADTFTFSVDGDPGSISSGGHRCCCALVDVAGGWSALAVARRRPDRGSRSGSSASRAARAARASAPPRCSRSSGSSSRRRPSRCARSCSGSLGVAVGALGGRDAERRVPARRWLLPAIALAVANIHGSFPIVVVIAAARGRSRTSIRGDRRGLIVALVTAPRPSSTPRDRAVWAYVWESRATP